jgi:hypothetical protein
LNPERRPRVIYPFLIAAFPILSLFAHNIHEAAPRDLVAPILLALAGTFVVWLVLRWFSGSPERAGLATVLLVVAFFSFDQITRRLDLGLYFLSTFWIRWNYNIDPRIVLVLVTVLVAPALWVIFRRVKRPEITTSYLNVFALVLVALPISSAVSARVQEPAKPLIQGGGAGVPTAAKPERLPDIYYIVLDSYARSDTLKDLFGLDNEPFLRRLEQKGFHVCRQSTSNYAYTALSLCSSLNGDYLDRLIDPSARDLVPLGQRIADNFMINSLRPHGYKFVTFATGFDPTDHPEVDLYLYPRPPGTGFHSMLMAMTPLQILLPDVGFWDNYTYLRERTRFTLDHLPDITAIEEPTFTFAHIVCPHPPFVFGEHGEDISLHEQRTYNQKVLNAESYRRGYALQAKYITEQIEPTIDRILARSPEPPIIILQSDHGSGLRHHLDDLENTDIHERMSILNCYYFPDRNYDGLNDRITPVNSFRVVLNQFFGATLPLLEERNYFSLYSDPLVYIDVTTRLGAEDERRRQFKPAKDFLNMIY